MKRETYGVICSTISIEGTKTVNTSEPYSPCVLLILIDIIGFTGISGTGQNIIIAVGQCNGTGQGISQRLKCRIGQDRIFQEYMGRDGTERDGTGLVFLTV